MNKVNLNASHMVRVLKKSERVVLEDVLRLERAGDDLLVWVRQVDGSVQLQRLQDFYLPGQDAVLVVEASRQGDTPLQLTAQTELPQTVLADGASPERAGQDAQGDGLWLQMLASDLAHLDAPLAGDAIYGDTSQGSVLSGLYRATEVFSPQRFDLAESQYGLQAEKQTYVPRPIVVDTTLAGLSINIAVRDAVGDLTLGTLHSDTALTLKVTYRGAQGTVTKTLPTPTEQTAWVWTSAEKQALLAQLGEGAVSVQFHYEMPNGQLVGNPYFLNLLIDTAAPVMPVIEAPAAMADGYIARSEALAGVLLQGTAEAGSTVSLKWQGQPTAFASVQADAQGRWQHSATLTEFLQAGSGQAVLLAQSTDAVGNTSGQAQYTAQLLLSLPSVPTAQLDPQSQTGTGNSVTQDTTPTFRGRAPANGQVLWYRDTNGNDQIDASETVFAQASVGADGQYTITLPAVAANSQHVWLVKAVDAAGNVSEDHTKVSLDVDTLPPQAPVLDTLAGGDGISFAELAAGVVLSGRAEANASVNVVRTQGSIQETVMVTANAVGIWRLPLSASEWAGFVDGPVDFSVTQTDLAGNVSEPTTLSTPVRVTGVDPVAGLTLVSADDTGYDIQGTPQFITDGLTRITQPRLQVQATAFSWVRLVRDANNNGLLDGSEAVLAEFQVPASGVTEWQFPQPLNPGNHRVLALGWDPVTGSYSNIDAATGQTIAVTAKVDLSIDTQAPAAPTMASVTPDDSVSLTEIASGVLLSGTAEAHAKVTLSWSHALNPIQVQADDAGLWTASLSSAQLNQLGGGSVTVTVTATDKAGNSDPQTSVLSKTFAINTTQPGAPRVLSIAAAEDLGQSQSDGITSDNQLSLLGRAAANSQVQIFNDLDNDGFIDNGELLDSVTADANGDFVSQKTFADDTYRLRAVATVGGNTSVANDSFLLQVDSHTPAVSGLVMAQNNQINIAKRAAGVTFSGQGERVADVTVTLENNQGQAVLGANQQPLSWTARVNPQSAWSVLLTSAEIALLPQGQLSAKVVQTSLSGAQSTVVSHAFEVDTVAPGGSAAAQTAADAANAASELADGLDWLELKDGTQVAVALPDNLGADGALSLSWGNQNIAHNVTSTEISQGFALIDVPAEAIFLAGASNALSVTASFVDKFGNLGNASVPVLQQGVNMAAQPPSALPDVASYHRFVDGKYYTKDVQGVDFQLGGLPGATVVVYEDTNGNGQFDTSIDSSFRVQLDNAGSGTGQLVLSVGEHVLHTFATLQGSNSQTSTATITVVVDNASPTAPTLNSGYDDLISAAERDVVGGVPISGSAEPGADVSYQLLNEQTGVLSQVYTVRAGLAGQWSAQLDLSQWIQVGDGTIRLLLSQTDLAGNVSPAVLPANAPALVLDSVVRAPTIGAVTGNDGVNASEAAVGITLSGGAEAQATVRMELSGSQGSITLSQLVADSRGVWTTNLSSTQLQQTLGEGPVTVTARQTDRAGNVSSTGTRTFVIDTRIEGLSLQTVGTNDHLDAVQTSENQVLEGLGEVGALVSLMLTHGATHLPTKTATVGSNGRWQMVLTPAEMATGLQIGTSAAATVTVNLSQTDAAGNVQSLPASSWTIDRRPLAGTLTLDPVGGDENVSYTEQATPLVFSGTAPVGTQVHVRLIGAQGTVLMEPVTVSGVGVWQMTLTTEQMRTDLGAGSVRVQAWAVDLQTLQSSSLTQFDEGAFILQGLVPSPVVERVGGDGFVNADEAQAGPVVIGTGVPGDQIALTYTGTQGNITRSVAVGVDGSWRSVLSLSDVNALGEGAVALSAVQSNGTSNSVAVAADFVIDTVLPQAPRAQDVQAAQTARAAGEMLAGVTAVEAADGVVVALPLHADAKVGDKIELFWGTQDFAAATHVLTEVDIPATGTRVLELKVAGDAIARVGSGSHDLVMRMTDTANNVGSLVTVVSGLAVNAPPRAPQIGTVMTDGYINKAEFDAAASLPDSLRVSGTADSGQLTLTVASVIDGNLISSVSRTVSVSGGEWFVNLSQSEMSTLGEGALQVSAQLDQGNGIVSAVATRNIVFDKTLPEGVAAADAQLALERNAKGELAGGLIAMADNNGLTEAYDGTLVHVGLAADAQSGDRLTLYWGSGVGSGGTEVNYTVTQADVANRYAAIAVSEDIITSSGDSSSVRVEAQAIDRAGNPGARYEVWTGVVDAVPGQPSLFTIGLDGWVNAAELNQGVTLSGQGLSGHRFELALTSGLGAQAVTITKNANNQLVNSQGAWSLDLSSADLNLLGQGEVQVKVRQVDVPTIVGMPGNPSRWQTGSFQIDTIVPDAPTIARMAGDDRISQIESVNGVSISGTAEASARVNLTFKSGSNVLTTLVATANDQGQWQVSLTDFTGWTTSQNLQVLATQTDLAGNVSTLSGSRTFSYSSQVVAPPANVLVFGASPQDIYFNAQDLQDPSNPAGQAGFTVSGTGTVGSGYRVRLEIEIGGVLYNTDPVSVTNGQWSVHMAQPFAQGSAIVRAVQISPDGDESAAALYPNALVIDTVSPELQVAQVQVQDANGNTKAHAKLGDVLLLKLRLSEGVDLSLDNNQNPTLALNLGGSQAATYDAVASQAAGTNVLVFKYVVQQGDAVLEGGLGSMLNTHQQFAIDWHGAQVIDQAGNLLGANTVLIQDNTVRVDTSVPLAPALLGLVAADGSSVAASAATSVGGAIVNLQELVDGKAVLSIDLTQTGALANDKLKLTFSWPEGSGTATRVVEKVLLPSDIAANATLMTLDAGLLSGLEKTVSLSAVLEDVAGNVSPASSILQVVVDSLVQAPGIGLIGTDDRLSKAEVDALSGSGAAITFSNIEAGATLSARIVQTVSGVSNQVVLPVASLAGGGQGVTAQALASAVSSLQDGVWTVQVTQTDLAGNSSAVSSRAVAMDRVVPNAPGLVVSAIGDGWVNKAEVQNGLSVQVQLSGSTAGAGDKLKFSWQVNASTVNNHEITLDASQINAGTVSVLLPADKLLQANVDSVQALNLRVNIEDRGGNESPVTAVSSTVKLDTVVLKPVVLVNGVDANGHLPTVSPLSAQSGGTISGTAEEGASVVLVLRGEGGDTLRFPVTGSNTGSFTAQISANDYTLLGGGLTTSVVSYSVFQTDKAGNVSETATGSFDLQLQLPAPIFIDLTNDNLVSLSESNTTQTLQGLGTTGATVSVTFYNSQNQLLTAVGTKNATVTAGGWSVNLTAADFANMGSGTIKAVAKQNMAGTDSAEETMNFVVDRVSPSLALTGAVALFDGNGDGSSNDGLLITFSENVKSYSIKEVGAWSAGTKTLGTGARIETVNEEVINGATFARQYRIYLGQGATLAAGDVIRVSANNLEDTTGNTAAADQNITVPSLVVPSRPVPQLNISTDNFMNASEVAAATTIQYSYGAVAVGSKVRLFSNGVQLAESTVGTTAGSSTTATSFTLSGVNTWGSDGQKNLVAQIETNGAKSLYAVPKSFMLDTSLTQEINAAVVLNHTGAGSTVNAGETLRVVFKESVGLTNASLSASVFGTGATVTAVGAVGGKSTTWDIVAGTGNTLSGNQRVTFTGVTDRAGNTGSIGADLPADLVSVPGQPWIGNVSADNVLVASDKGVLQTVTVNLSKAMVGDVVKLFVDGREVGSKVLEAGDLSAVNLSVNADAFGGDGTRNLTSSIQRGSGAVIASNAKPIYVNMDASHWTTANGANTAIWFDPNTLAATGLGQKVSSWSASAGGSTATQTLASGQPLLTTMNGQQALFLNGSNALEYNDPLGILWDVSKKTGMDITGFVAVAPTNLTGGFQSALAFWGSTGPATGVKLGIGPSSALAYTVYAKKDFSGTANSVSLNNATTMTLRDYKSGSNYVIEGYNQNLLQLSSTGTTAQINIGAVPTRYRIGSDANQPGIQYAWQGYIADVIWLNYKATDALMQEVQVYLSAKYGSSGSDVAKNGSNVYDLSASSVSSLLLDDRLTLNDRLSNDTITTGGADYLLAGSGRDTVIVKDLDFRTLDGGDALDATTGVQGLDTLRLSANYTGPNAIVLADLVSNARGMSGNAIDDARVNAKGFHKLQNFEALDLSSSTARQILTVTPNDVAQLSETNRLEVVLGNNDVLLTLNFTTNYGHYLVNGTHYSAKYTADSVEMFVQGGQAAPDLQGSRYYSNAIQLDFNTAMYGSVNVGDFQVDPWGANAITPTLAQVSAVNVRQGIYLTFNGALSGPVKVTYSGALVDEYNRGYEHSVWGIGSDSNDTLDASAWAVSKGVALSAGGGNDRVTGTAGSDVIVGGLGSDTMTGGTGSDRFRYITLNENTGGAGGLGGLSGDVITDFNTDVNSTNADVLDLSQLFASTLATNGNAQHDAAAMIAGGYIDLVKTNGGRDLQVFIDRDGGGAMGLLATLQSVGTYTNSVSGESTEQLLQRLLTEGRMQVTHA